MISASCGYDPPKTVPNVDLPKFYKNTHLRSMKSLSPSLTPTFPSVRRLTNLPMRRRRLSLKRSNLLFGLNDIEIRLVRTNGTKVTVMGMGESGAAGLFIDILIASKPFERFLCNHQMGISSRHKGPAMLGFKSIEINI